jgi:hypothetical protein
MMVENMARNMKTKSCAKICRRRKAKNVKIERAETGIFLSQIKTPKCVFNNPKIILINIWIPRLREKCEGRNLKVRKVANFWKKIEGNISFLFV